MNTDMTETRRPKRCATTQAKQLVNVTSRPVILHSRDSRLPWSRLKLLDLELRMVCLRNNCRQGCILGVHYRPPSRVDTFVAMSEAFDHEHQKSITPRNFAKISLRFPICQSGTVLRNVETINACSHWRNRLPPRSA